jgi:hypothetical protein
MKRGRVLGNNSMAGWQLTTPQEARVSIGFRGAYWSFFLSWGLCVENIETLFFAKNSLAKQANCFL